MHRFSNLGIVFGLLLAGMAAAQDGGTLYPDSIKTDSVKTDSVVVPEKSRLQRAIEAGERAAEGIEEPADSAQRVPPSTPAVDPGSAERAAVEKAQLWVRHLLFRGWLNPTVVGAFCTYQLTSWGEGTGSYGPVDGKLTIHYLGSTEWMGKDAEWLQAAYYTMESEPELIEFDLIVPAMQRVTEVYRVLYRVDRGELRAGSFAVPAGQVDLDAVDRPAEAGAKAVTIFAGTFDCTLYRGTGDIASEVLAYRDRQVTPLEIVVLGYGDEGLTYSASGAEVTPRFKSPPPLK